MIFGLRHDTEQSLVTSAGTLQTLILVSIYCLGNALVTTIIYWLGTAPVITIISALQLMKALKPKDTIYLLFFLCYVCRSS